MFGVVEIDREIVRYCDPLRKFRVGNTFWATHPGMCKFLAPRTRELMSMILKLSALNHYWAEKVFDDTFYHEPFPKTKEERYQENVRRYGVSFVCRWIAKTTPEVESV